MNMIILYAMGLASLAVLIAGAFFLVVLIVYGIQRIWANPCPKPYRRPWPRETAVRLYYQSTSKRSTRPTARSSIKQRRNRRKP